MRSDHTAGQRLDGPSRFWRGAAVFLLLVAFYHAKGKPIAEVDCVTAPFTAWALARHGDFDLRGFLEPRSDVVELPDGRWVSKYPPGAAVAALPVVAPMAIIRPRPFADNTMLRVGQLVAALYVAGTVLVFFRLCRIVAPGGAVMATLLLALGTCLYSVAAQALWAHGPATFFVCLGMYCAAAPPQGPTVRRAFVAGLALGAAVAVRPTTILLAPALLVPLLTYRRVAACAAALAGVGIPVALLVSYNLVHFGVVVAGGYGSEASQWTTPVYLGFTGLLVAPSRGLLVFTPALLFAPLGLWVLWRRRAETAAHQRSVLLLFCLAGAATIVLYGAWHVWWGGWSFGPRFLIEVLPIFCLLFGLAYASLRSEQARRLAICLVIFSVTIHLLGVFGNNRHWKVRHGTSQSMFAFHDTQIEAHLRQLLGSEEQRN